jgi:ATP-binding protein involved in chromosome partitioning
MSDPASSLRDEVRAALGGVTHPDSGADVVSAGLVDDVSVDGSSVTVEADLARLDADADRLLESMLAAARDVSGVESVHVEPAAGDDADRVPLAGVDTVVAVASTKGGVGKSTVATHLACALAADHDVGIFDADLFGPNVPDLLDVDGPIMADEEDRPIPVDAGGLELLSVGLMTDGGPLAWRGAMAHEALSDLFADAAWAHPDVVVVDLPPGTSDVALTTLQEVRIDGVVFVTTPFRTSVEDTRRSLRLFRENDVPVLGTVVNMDGFVCEACGHDHDLFEEDADALDTPVLARLPFAREFQSGPRPGTAPDAVRSLATDVLDAVDGDPIDVPDDPVDIRGLGPDERYDRVSETFTSLSAGEEYFLVSDRDPRPAGEFLVELAGERGSPAEALPAFDVWRRDGDEWVLRAIHP